MYNVYRTFLKEYPKLIKNTLMMMIFCYSWEKVLPFVKT